MADIVMPRLSDSMEEGTILRWLRAPGDAVRRGEEIVEIETDKATMTYESDQDGVLELVAAEGDTLPIGAVIARVVAGGEQATQGDGAAPARAAGATPAAELPAQGAVLTAEQPTQTATPAAEQPAAAGAERPVASPAAAVVADERVKASPLARRIARERGLDLGGVTGSGPGGRIVRADVEATPAAPAAVAPQATAAPAPAIAATSSPRPGLADVETAKGKVTVIEPTRTQQLVARRMAAAKATVPDFQLETEVDMQAAVALRDELRAIAREGDLVPSLNDIVVKACAQALREHPRANGAYRDGHFEEYARINVGIAVATDDALIVPTILDADRKRLSEIAAESRALAARVRDGTITPPELSGGTFTVSNLGMYAIRRFTAIINAPQAAILAVGETAPRSVVRNGELCMRDTMDVTLVCDHRILYGAQAALFLARIRTLLEHPLAMLA